MKILTLLILTTSLSASGQSFDPGAMGSSVGALNQVTDEIDQTGSMNQQDQQEKIHQDEKKREHENWEEQKSKADNRSEIPDEGD